MAKCPIRALALAVYREISKIPAGQVATYGQIACRIGWPGSARVLGQTLRKNPDAPRVPCHRVIRVGSRKK